jgi:hypothetical protein
VCLCALLASRHAYEAHIGDARSSHSLRSSAPYNRTSSMLETAALLQCPTGLVKAQPNWALLEKTWERSATGSFKSSAKTHPLYTKYKLDLDLYNKALENFNKQLAADKAAAAEAAKNRKPAPPKIPRIKPTIPTKPLDLGRGQCACPGFPLACDYTDARFEKTGAGEAHLSDVAGMARPPYYDVYAEKFSYDTSALLLGWAYLSNHCCYLASIASPLRATAPPLSQLVLVYYHTRSFAHVFFRTSLPSPFPQLTPTPYLLGLHFRVGVVGTTEIGDACPLRLNIGPLLFATRWAPSTTGRL